jgi:hypothetical protein
VSFIITSENKINTEQHPTTLEGRKIKNYCETFGKFAKVPVSSILFAIYSELLGQFKNFSDFSGKFWILSESEKIQVALRNFLEKY